MTEAEELFELLKNDYAEVLWGASPYWKTVDEIEGDSGRWSKTITVITESIPTGNHYRWCYEAGLTEYQDNELIEEMPQPVYKKEKTVVVTEWVEADK